MRFLTVTLLSTSIAFSAFAQDAVTPTTTTTTIPAANTPVATPLPTTISPNNVPTVGSNLPQPVNPAAPTNAIVKTKPALDDIGYDPRVKRDPSGRIIDPTQRPSPTTSEAPSLRTDSGSSLRSDVRKPTVTAPAQPILGKPRPLTQGVTNGLTTTTVTTPAR